MIKTIGDSGINWNWYLCGDFDKENKTVHVFYYDRWHKYENRGSRHPANADWSAHMQLLEDNSRTLYGIQWAGIEYLVTNPQQIFSYKDMTHYVSE